MAPIPEKFKVALEQQKEQAQREKIYRIDQEKYKRNLAYYKGFINKKSYAGGNVISDHIMWQLRWTRPKKPKTLPHFDNIIKFNPKVGDHYHEHT